MIQKKCDTEDRLKKKKNKTDPNGFKFTQTETKAMVKNNAQN